MAFTTTDLDQVEQAIMELVNGVRKVRIEIDGYVIEYGQAALADLMVLRDQMKTELGV